MTVAHIISGLDTGGAETVLYRLCTADTANRHVVVSLMGEGAYGSPLRERGIDVYCLHMPRGRVTARGVRALWRLLRRHRPDIVQTWMYHADLIGGVLASAARIPACWGIRSGHLLWTNGQRITIMLRLVNALLSWFVPAAIVSNSTRAAGIHRRLGYCGRKIVVIPNGIDTERFAPDVAARAAFRREWNLMDSVPVLGTVGRDTPYKDYDTLFAALGRLKTEGHQFRFVMAGKGLEAGNVSLHAKLVDAGIMDRVVLCGVGRDIPAVMNALDCFVLSSAAESFPSVLIEAMACGVPCVTTAVGDAEHIVGDAGRTVPPKDPVALAGAIVSVLALPVDEAARARAAARDTVVQRFGISNMLDRYQALWAGQQR